MRRGGVRASRIAALAFGAAAGWLVSCSDMGVGSGDVYSISQLLLPSPGMVVGDTMRDSAGVVAPLRIIAFNAKGDTVPGTTKFVTLDTFAHLVGGSLLVGDRTGVARVLGEIGTLQTLPEAVTITLSPDTIVATDSIRHVKTYSVLSGDTIANSADLSARVLHRQGTTTSDVDAVIVRYSIVSAPPSKNNLPTIVLMNGSASSSRDTTTGGRVARTARLRLFSVAGGVATDSAVIRATASYRGQSIGTVQFTVIFKNQ